MRPLNTVLRWLPVALFVVCGGCLLSETPLVEPEMAGDPSSLVGTWVYTGKPQEDAKSITFVFKKTPAGFPEKTLDLETLTLRKNGEESRSQNFAYLAKLGDDDYLHIVSYGDPGRAGFDYAAWRKTEKREFQVWLIRQTEGQFELIAANNEKVGNILNREPDYRVSSQEMPAVKEAMTKEGAKAVYQEEPFLVFKRQDGTR